MASVCLINGFFLRTRACSELSSIQHLRTQLWAKWFRSVSAKLRCRASTSAFSSRSPTTTCELAAAITQTTFKLFIPDVSFRLQFPRHGRCVFWDDKTSSWSQLGLEKLSFSGFTTTCCSNHLSHFAIATVSEIRWALLYVAIALASLQFMSGPIKGLKV